MASDQNPLNEILTEKELLDLFGEKKTWLDRLRRNQQFPFCKVTDRSRFYLAKDVLEFIRSKRMVLDSHTTKASKDDTDTQIDDE